MRSIVFGPVIASLCLATSIAQAAGFTLSSPDIKPGATIADEQVFNSFGCSGQNVSPALKWSGAPEDTKSFAVDGLRPRCAHRLGLVALGRLQPPGVEHAKLPAGAGAADGKALPAGAMQGRTDFGTPAYGGPCPPAGDKPHRYIFTRLRAEDRQARRAGRRDRSADRLHDQRQQARFDDLDRPLRPQMKGGMMPRRGPCPEPRSLGQSGR